MKQTNIPVQVREAKPQAHQRASHHDHVPKAVITDQFNKQKQKRDKRKLDEYSVPNRFGDDGDEPLRGRKMVVETNDPPFPDVRLKLLDGLAVAIAFAHFCLVPHGCKPLMIRAYTFVEKEWKFEKIIDMKKV
ncbi:hypothetical protein ACFXTH_037216 [Malus domestica]